MSKNGIFLFKKNNNTTQPTRTILTLVLRIPLFGLPLILIALISFVKLE